MAAEREKKQVQKIEERILNARLTPKDKVVLDYLMKNQDFACFQTSNEIADHLGVSPSSVIRLSAKLGYENFAQLKRAMQEEVARKRTADAAAPIPYEKIKEADKLTDRELIGAIKQNVMNNLAKDEASIEDAAFLKAAAILSEGKRIFVAGFRALSGFAESFGVMLACVRPNVYAVANNQPMIDFLVDLSEEDVMVAISYERYSSETILAVRMAKQAGSRVVALTDSLVSPIAEGADAVIVNSVENFSFYNSYVCLAMSMDILVGLVSKYNKAQNEERLIKMEIYLKETGQY